MNFFKKNKNNYFVVFNNVKNISDFSFILNLIEKLENDIE